MIRINSLNDLFIEELADLLNAENQLVEALPKMAQGSHSPAFRVGLEDCLEITRDHIQRLEKIFKQMAQHPQRLSCKAVRGLINESDALLESKERSPEIDTAIINVVKRIQHFKIVRYKIAREHAADLGEIKIGELLTKTLDEERALNFHFNELAQGFINHHVIGPAKQYF